MLVTIQIADELRNVLTENEVSVEKAIGDLKAAIKSHKKMLEGCSYENYKDIQNNISRMKYSLDFLENIMDSGKEK